MPWATSFSEFFPSGARAQPLLIAPDLERKRSGRRLRLVDHDAGAHPSRFLVEPRSALVADRAGEPGNLNALLGEPSFGVGNQASSDTGAASLGGNVELKKLVVMKLVEAEGGDGRPGHSHVRQGCFKPLAKIEQGSEPSQLDRHQAGVGCV